MRTSKWCTRAISHGQTAFSPSQHLSIRDYKCLLRKRVWSRINRQTCFHTYPRVLINFRQKIYFLYRKHWKWHKRHLEVMPNTEAGFSRAWIDFSWIQKDQHWFTWGWWVTHSLHNVKIDLIHFVSSNRVIDHRFVPLNCKRSKHFMTKVN